MCVKLNNCIIIFETMRYKLIECKGAIYSVGISQWTWTARNCLDIASFRAFCTVIDFYRFVLETDNSRTLTIPLMFIWRFALLNGCDIDCILILQRDWSDFAINLSFSILLALGKHFLLKQFLCNLHGCVKCLYSMASSELIVWECEIPLLFSVSIQKKKKPVNNN